MLCRLCNRDRKLIKAHVIPEAFFRSLRSGGKAPEIHTNTKGAYPKRAPIGVYDRTILCGECDGCFSPWDDHAQQVLIRDFSEALPLYDESRKVAYRIQRFNYNLLKLFFLSLLWRASVSNHKFYRRISVGPYEEILRGMLLTEDPGTAEKFAVTLARFSDPQFTGMLDPHAERYEGVNYCRFYLTGFVAYIKVDRRPPPSFLRDFVISEDSQITVILRDLHESKDGAVMKAIARKSLYGENA